MPVIAISKVIDAELVEPKSPSQRPAKFFLELEARGILGRTDDPRPASGSTSRRAFAQESHAALAEFAYREIRCQTLTMHDADKYLGFRFETENM